MPDEIYNSIPSGDPPMPEDIVPASPIAPDSVSSLESIHETGLASEFPRVAPETPEGSRAPIEDASPVSGAPPPAPRRRGNDLWTLLVAAAAWIIPGAGYVLQRRWARAAVGFAGVAALAIIGLKMRGNVFPPHGTEPFDFLGFIADVGSGIFYFCAKNVEAAGPDVSRAAGDYGTRLFATAGILNLLLVLDAVEIARGEKS